jgi:hypothetical protein
LFYIKETRKITLDFYSRINKLILENKNVNKVMSVKKAFSLAILFFVLTSCSSRNNSGSDNSSINNQEWKLLLSERQCAITAPKQVLIKNQSDFDKLWQETFEGIGQRPQKPVVNFSEKWIIACYLGEVNTGGHEISIEKIQTDKNLTTVIIKHVKPGVGCMTTMAIEYPFIMVAVSQFSPHKVEFKTVIEERKCE